MYRYSLVWWYTIITTLDESRTIYAVVFFFFNISVYACTKTAFKIIQFCIVNLYIINDYVISLLITLEKF